MSTKRSTITKQIVMLAVGAVIGILMSVASQMGFLGGLALAALMSAVFYFPVYVIARTHRILFGILTFIVLIIYLFTTAAGDHNVLMMLPLVAVPVCVVLSIVRS